MPAHASMASACRDNGVFNDSVRRIWQGAEESSDPTASETSSEEPEEAYDENTWFLKAEYTSTNESGAEVDGTCEAKVTGTTDSPEVIEFTVY